MDVRMWLEIYVYVRAWVYTYVVCAHALECQHVCQNNNNEMQNEQNI